jgi:DNA integrity scanning protein DisA with diadenylate cyclase activity
VVSEERGAVSFATEGKFETNLTEQRLTDLLYEYYN